MLKSELVDLVHFIQETKCESNYIEVKSAKNGCPRVLDTLSSFSNQKNGGKIVFGIDENDDYNICGVYDAADLEKKLMEQSLQMEPVVRPLCTVALVDNKVVVCAEVQEISSFQKPCFYKGAGRLRGSYIRVGDGDRLMSEYEIYSYEIFKQNIKDELRRADNAETEDIYTDGFTEYMLRLKKTKPNIAAIPMERLIQLQGFVQNGKPTLAGLMLFGLYPQAYFRRLSIAAVRVLGNEVGVVGSEEERFSDSVNIEGSIPQMLDLAIQFVIRNSRVKTIINSTTGKREDKYEYPIIAVRELILNSLVHRDYSAYTENSPITVRMFDDRIEIENPGELYGWTTLDDLGKVNADTRNPYIVGGMEVLNLLENRFSGIPTIRMVMKEAGLPEPVFESSRGRFKATLYNRRKD